ncbi:TolC family protein [Megalodesulfovibrio gigas]|uniref:TolC family protein n=1 Tax=Megalodesulfovibrio gigas TaxID=879 RepID=UPI00042365D2|nr:TolC family protein [Megalodesulfovibrio gigas]
MQLSTLSSLRFGASGWAVRCLLACVVAALCSLGAQRALALPADGELPPVPIPAHPLTYKECVALALQNSPYFVPSGVEIKVKRLDAWDKRMELLPDFFVNTNLRLNNPDGRNSAPISVSFSFGQYDPLQAYFSIGAYKIMVQRAAMEHVKTIDEGLFSLAQIYISMELWSRAALVHDEIIDVARQQKAYAVQRYNAGYGSTLDVMYAERQYEDAINQKRKNELTHQQAFERLKSFLGAPREQALTLNLENAVRQVTGDFNPRTISLEEAKRNSLEIQIRRLDNELQGYQVRLAYAKFLPKYTLGLSREYSALSNSDVFVATVGLTIPVLDWGERYRGVIREKRRVVQARAEERMKTLDFENEFYTAQGAVEDAAQDLKLVATAREIASLERQRAEIMYRSGSIEFPEFTRTVERDLEARLVALSKEFEYDQAVLKLRYISGDLHSSMLDVAAYNEQ